MLDKDSHIITEISPFATQLSSLASSNLESEELSILGQIIDYLILQLDSGHSCAKLEILSADLNLVSEVIISILLKSEIVAKFSSVDVSATISIQHIQPSIINNISIANKPIHLVSTPNGQYLIYITRYLHYELQIVYYLSQLIKPTNITSSFILKAEKDLSQLSIQQPGLPNQQQHLAVLTSLKQQFSIITGGPGTGKTTTVILILFMLYQYYGKSLKIRICAPTGKAIARVKESLQISLNTFDQLGIDISKQNFIELLHGSINFGTIHKLLGYLPNQIYFKHNKDNPLDAEVVIIDESSMIGLPLFSKLIAAINPKITKHIILLGDKNQLSSVEEGYVFASLVNHFMKINSKTVVELTESKRNIGSVGRLANQILNKQIDLAFKTLITDIDTRLEPCTFKSLIYQICYNKNELSYANYVRFIQENSIQETLNHEYIQKLFACYTQFTVLCMSNQGKFGTYNLNSQIEQQIKLQLETSSTWYTGRPIIITENDTALGLYNGDIGICQLINGKEAILFNNAKSYIPEVLPPYKLAFAITIHKAQGSEFDSVAIVLKPDDSKINITDNFLVKELVYTAVTRAKNKIIIYSGHNKLKHALSRHTTRYSGLEYFLG